MNNLPRKLVTTGGGIAGLLALMKFDVSLLSYVSAVGIIVISIISMALQHHADLHNAKGNHNGKV